MRELKFRAWDIDNKQFIYARIGQDDVWLDDGISTIEMPFHHSDFEQYTGLKDKNDKEIYEGDILSAWNKYYKVVFESLRAGFVAKIVTGGSETDHFAGYFGKYLVNHCEVIGNIHENPELLEHKG